MEFEGENAQNGQKWLKIPLRMYIASEWPLWGKSVSFTFFSDRTKWDLRWTALDLLSIVTIVTSNLFQKRSWASSISWQGALVEGQDGSLMGRLAARIQIADFAPSISVKRKKYKTKVEMISQPPWAPPYYYQY